MKKIYRGNKLFKVFIFLGVVISFFWSIYNLNKFDKIKLNFDGKYYNKLLYSDLEATWITADKFKKELDQGNNFFLSIPSYERFLLPSIIVGFYYHLINKDIFINSNDGKTVIKENNFKINILLIQIFFYFFALYLFYTELKKKIKGLTLKIVIFFLCLEPSLLQWHSSFWSESIFLSLMLLLFFLLLKNSQSVLINFSIGIIIGLMFIQRTVSFLYIFPLLIYFILIFKKNLKPLIVLLLGYLLFIFVIGYNNYKKTSYFYFVPWWHQYNSYYHYFSNGLVAHSKNINSFEAKKFLEDKEKLWRIENKINMQSIADIFKNINYRNNIFLEEVLKNKFYTSKFLAKKVITMSIIHPFWVNQHFYFDKTDPLAKNNPKEYYNKNLYKNLPYSFFIYFFTILGVFQVLKEILKKKEISTINKFYIFNFFSILYFILISGFWGNPKYFAPCMISISFFFSVGFKYIFDKYKYKSKV